MAWTDAARAAALEARRRHMKSTRISKQGPGHYSVTLKRHNVTANIVRNPALRGKAKWITHMGHMADDPVLTKAEAHRNAVSMVRQSAARHLRMMRSR